MPPSLNIGLLAIEHFSFAIDLAARIAMSEQELIREAIALESWNGLGNLQLDYLLLDKLTQPLD
jgi:hypothetical protein